MKQPLAFPLKGGVKVLVDAPDRALLERHGWFVARNSAGTPYVTAKIGGRTTALHRLIMKAPGGMVVDHINHDTLDNRRSNLRVVTVAENGQNRLRAASHSRTGIRGVFLHDYYGRRKYIVSVTAQGKRYRRSFEGTERGLRDAMKHVIEKRRELQTGSLD